MHRKAGIVFLEEKILTGKKRKFHLGWYDVT
jgi:hypothetical protein